MLQSNALSFDQEVSDMQIATHTLINDYCTIHANTDPIDRDALLRSAVKSMRSYFDELALVPGSGSSRQN